MPIREMDDSIYKAALTSGHFLSKDRSVIQAQLADMTMQEISALKGFGPKRVAAYARWAGRDAELLSLDKIEFPKGVSRDDGLKEIFLDRLQREYEADTFNDEMSLDRLADLYVQRHNMPKGVPQDSESMRIAKQIDDSILALEKHLQIDPQTRAAQAAAADPAAIIGDWVDQSALYLADEGVIHDTENGPAGYTIWHFKTPNYMPRCKDCGGQHLVFRSPWDEEDYDFLVARPDQVERYVRGRDFTPENAPALSIFEEKPE